MIWFSERDNWGHLYLYDLETGTLKNQITSGEGNVTQLLRVDEKTGACSTSWRWAARRAATRTSSTSTASGSTASTWRCSRRKTPTTRSRFRLRDNYFVDSYSTARRAAGSAAARRRRARPIATLEKADISRLLAAGWKPPHAVHREGARRRHRPLRPDVPARLISTPPGSTPIVNHIYPGPQTGSVGSRNFSAARGDAQALAELGFIVVEIDGMGTPWRSKKFHEAYYGDMGDNTLPDQVAGMKQLAAALSLDRPRPRRHLRPLGRRLRRRRRHVPLPRFLQGGHLRSRQSRQPRVRGRLGGEVAGPARAQARRRPPTTTARPTRTSPRT